MWMFKKIKLRLLGTFYKKESFWILRSNKNRNSNTNFSLLRKRVNEIIVLNKIQIRKEQVKKDHLARIPISKKGIHIVFKTRTSQ